MFTGLIQQHGTLLAHERGATGVRLRVSAPLEVISLLQTGDSVAVNGVCLTALNLHLDTAGAGSPPDKILGSFSADLAHETIARTTLGGLRVGSPVNLELPTPAGAPLGGHIVQGHVDGVAKVLALESLSGSGDGDWWLKISLPAELAQYVVEKGSIALDGISLTIAHVEPDRLESNPDDPNLSDPNRAAGTVIGIAILPHTYRSTNLHTLRIGDPINIEVDVLAKYAAQAGPQNIPFDTIAAKSEKFELTLEYLLANGY